jgi:hypothetical protein
MQLIKGVFAAPKWEKSLYCMHLISVEGDT